MKRFLLVSLALVLTLSSCTKARKSTAMEQSPAQYKVKLQTTKGDVIVLVHRDWSPLGADHFYELVKMGFYNKNYFFRVVRGFIVQFGINGDPAVNKPWSEITIKDDPAKVPNKTGSIAFAQTGEPNSRTTQVFINLRDNSATLDPQHFTPFGEIIEGLDSIMHIYGAYGDGPPQGEGPNQAAIADIGNPYLEEHFPKLDGIKRATIVP